MKNLFIVFIAVGILSNTPISTEAQKAVNSLQGNERKSNTKSVKFIDGIEISNDFTIKEVNSETTPVVTQPQVKTPVRVNESKSAIESCNSLQFKYAQLMEVEVESLTNNKLLEFIDEWWATRYRYGGTTKKGIDCSSLTGSLLRDVYGVIVPRTAREQYRISVKIPRSDLKEGDFVFFNTRGGISHVGIYLANGKFLHSSVHSGVTISSLDESYYSKKYIGGGRPNLEQVITENEE